MNRIITIMLFGLLMPLSQIVAQNPVALSFAPASFTGSAGQTIAVDVKVSDFTDIIAAQYFLKWDEALLQFDSVSDIMGSVSNPSPAPPDSIEVGQITINSPTALSMPGVLQMIYLNKGLLDITGKTLPANSKLFTMHFTLLGDVGTTTIDFSCVDNACEVDHEDDIIGSYTISPFNLTNNGGVVVGPIALTAGNASGPTGSTKCIPVSVTGFNDIIDFESTLNYDDSKLSSASIQNINASVAGLDMSDFNIGTAGQVVLDWSNVTGQTIGDEILYEVCFELSGTGGSTSPISFSNNSAMSSSESITVNPNSGLVTIESSADFQFHIGDVSACPGDTDVCVPFKVRGFQNIAAVQMQIGFNTDNLSNIRFVDKTPSVEEFSMNGIPIGSDSLRVIGISSFPSATNAKLGSDIGDDEILFEVCFDVIGGLSTIDINAISTGAKLKVGKYIDEVNTQVPVTVFPGSIGAIVPTLDQSVVTDIVCGGETTGAIDLVVTGGTPDFTFNWIPAATSEDISGVGPGNYAVTVTDRCNSTVSGSYTIVETNTEIMITGTTTNASNLTATDGTIDITVTGGSGSPTFIWDTGSTDEDPTNFAAGEHSVTVTDGGCTKIASFTVESDQVDLAINDDITTILDVECFGECNGAINVGIIGGTGAYTASWDAGVGGTTVNVSGLCAGQHCVTITDGVNSVSQCYTVNQPAAPLSVVPDIAHQTVCGGDNNGIIDLTVEGGSPNYNFAWSNSATSKDILELSSGEYTVTVTDSKGCSSVNTYTVACGDPLVINGTTSVVTDESCGGANDGTIILAISGGTSPFSFLWSNTSTQQNQGSLAPGSHTVTVTDANDLTATQTFTVNPATPIVVTGDVTIVSGNGGDGAIILNISGGVPPYSQSWTSPTNVDFPTPTISTNIADLDEGTYIVIVMDSEGCSVEKSFVVGGTFGFGTINITDINCFGEGTGQIHLSINAGEPPFTYLWSNNEKTRDIENLVAGNYCLTVTDNFGATISNCWDVIEPTSGLDIAINKQDVIGATLGSINITVSGGTKPYSYLWSNGKTSEDITGLMKDCYSVTVTDTKGCVMSTGDNCIEAPFVPGDVTKSEPKCNQDCDGSISFLLYGGQPPFSVKWTAAGHDKTIGLNGPNTIFADKLCAGTYGVTVTDNAGDTYVETFVLTEPTAINVASTIDEENAIIDISPTGGVAPYTYLWSRNGEKNEDLLKVASGTYIVTVTDDNGCRKVESFIVKIPPISVTSTVVKPECPDDKTGSIDLTVTGGIKPYVYSWSPSVSNAQDLFNIPAGTYSVTVTDVNGVSFPYDVILDAESDLKAELQLTHGISAPGACDGIAFVGVSGGEAPYSYVWRNNDVVLSSITENITGLCEGLITVEVTDKIGCSMTTELLLVAPVKLEIIINQRKAISCDDECDGILEGIPRGGTAPYTYKWSNSSNGQTASELCSDAYSVTVTDANGIQAIDEFELFSPDALEITFNVSPPTIVGGSDGVAEVVVEGGTSPYNYEWNGGDCNSANCNFASGEYWVLITDARGCEITESVEVPTETIPCFSTSEILTLDGTHDGRNDFFRVRCIEGTNNRLTIFNRWGQLIYETENYQNDWRGVDIKGNAVAEGAYYYILEVNGAGGGDQYKGHITILK